MHIGPTGLEAHDALEHFVKHFWWIFLTKDTNNRPTLNREHFPCRFYMHFLWLVRILLDLLGVSIRIKIDNLVFIQRDPVAFIMIEIRFEAALNTVIRSINHWINQRKLKNQNARENAFIKYVETHYNTLSTNNGLFLQILFFFQISRKWIWMRFSSPLNFDFVLTFLCSHVIRTIWQWDVSDQ